MKRQKRPKGRPITGWLIFDKPEDMTSTEAVGLIKRLYNAQKAGHAGTLDPLATGCLPIALGGATKTAHFIVDSYKYYNFTITWGEERDTDDAEGQTLKTSQIRPTHEDILALLPKFCGEIDQVPPQFSAIKVGGERAYDLAREGKTPTLEARRVFVRSFKCIEAREQSAVFEIECSKGTYVRSLARDMGRLLGCFGYISRLRRTRVSDFGESCFVSLDTLMALRDECKFAEMDELLEPLETALKEFAEIMVDASQVPQVVKGQTVLLRNTQGEFVEQDTVRIATPQGRTLGLGRVEKGQLIPEKLF